MASWKHGKIKFGFLETATSGGTLTLTSSSLQYQILTGSASHTVVLPNATTLAQGTGIAFSIVNVSTGSVTVKLNDTTTTLVTLTAGQGAAIFLTDNSTSNGTWVPKTGGASAASGIVAFAPSGVTIASGSRGLFGGGSTGSDSSTIDYIIFSSLSNAISFGTLTLARRFTGACSSSVRGIWGGGITGSPSNVMDYITIATLSNATSFGTLSITRSDLAGLSSATRGVFCGGNNGTTQVNTIDFITIATTGNATSFGTMISAKDGVAACASQTRGLIAAGNNGSGVTSGIEFITIASTGNGTTFGNLTTARIDPAGCSSSTRGIFAAGDTTAGSAVYTASMEFVTIATTGNASSFGNLSQSRSQPGAASSSVLGVWGGGTINPVFTPVSTIDYVTIATTGNAAAFGSLTSTRRAVTGCSDSHGGL